MDPYAVLGVARDATADHIKSAYRRRAKTLHPDIGGSRKAFEELRIAYDVLRDPVTRAYYDTTEKIPAKEAENMQAAAMTFLASVFDAAVANSDARATNIVLKMRAMIGDDQAARNADRSRKVAERKKWADIASRFIVKGQQQENRMAAIASATLALLDQQMKGLDQADEIAKAALAVLADYDYRTDQDSTQMTWMTRQAAN